MTIVLSLSLSKYHLFLRSPLLLLLLLILILIFAPSSLSMLNKMSIANGNAALPAPRRHTSLVASLTAKLATAPLSLAILAFLSCVVERMSGEGRECLHTLELGKARAH